MIQVKLREFLDAQGMSVYELAQAVVDETEALSEASVYKIVSGRRNPSLASLDLLVTALRRLTEKPVQLQDVVVYLPETNGIRANENHEELAEVWDLVRAQLPLVPVRAVDPALPLQPAPAHNRATNHPLRKILAACALGGVLLSLSLGAPLEPREADGMRRVSATMGVGRPPPDLIATPPASLTPTLQVSPQGDAIAYEFELINSVSGQVLISLVQPESSYRVPPTYLCRGTTYAWSARVQTATGWSSYATPARFHIDGAELPDTARLIPPAPELLFPSGTVASLTPTLRVSEVTEATHYGFYVRNLDSGALVYVNEFSKVPNHVLPKGVLQPDTRYRWNAQSRNCAGFSAYSSRFEFHTALSR